MTLHGQAALEHRQRSFELWQRMARPWERRRELAWRFTRPVSEWLVERVDPKPGQTLLELAAGTGETGFLAARRLGAEGRLILSDLAPEMVQAAERVASELGITNVEFRQGPAARDRGARGGGASRGAAGARRARCAVCSEWRLRATRALPHVIARRRLEE